MKKGFTMIELLIGVALIGIIMVAEVKVLSRYVVSYEGEILENRSVFYCNEALLFIQCALNRDVQGVKINNNEIEIFKTTLNCRDYIKLEKKNLTITYTENGYKKATNNIMKEVSNFQIEQNEKVVYVSITDYKGKKFERCFLITEAK